MSLAVTAIQQIAQVGLPILISSRPKGIKSILLPDRSTDTPDIIAQATVEELHADEMEITEHPVEQGAAITDHAFKLPSRVMLKMGWSNSSTPNKLLQTANIAASWAATLGGEAGSIAGGVVGAIEGGFNLLNNGDTITSIYNQILDLQRKRAVFTIYTSKRIYTNMMCRSIRTETDAATANSLLIMLDCQEVILVNTSIQTLPLTNVNEPENHGSTVDSGTQTATQK